MHHGYNTIKHCDKTAKTVLAVLSQLFQLKQFNVGSCKLHARVRFAVGTRAWEQRFQLFSSWERRFHTFTASRPACSLSLGRPSYKLPVSKVSELMLSENEPKSMGLLMYCIVLKTY